MTLCFKTSYTTPLRQLTEIHLGKFIEYKLITNESRIVILSIFSTNNLLLALSSYTLVEAEGVERD